MNMVHPLDAVYVAVALQRIPEEHKRSRGWHLHAIRFQGVVTVDAMSLKFKSLKDWNHANLNEQFQKFAGSSLVVGHAPSALMKKILGGSVFGSTPLFLDIGDVAGQLQPHNTWKTIENLRDQLLGDEDEFPNDASLIHQAYLALLKDAEALRGSELSAIALGARESNPVASALFANLASLAPGNHTSESVENLGESNQETGHLDSPVETESSHSVITSEIEQLFSTDGPLAERFPSYRPRREQIEMAAAVATALNSEDVGSRLIVEGGTGIGKSFAYLVPSVLFSFRNKTRVVISTGTINLQEQLIQKDVPEIIAALASVKGFNSQLFRHSQLKGRGNYLCLRRWEMLNLEQPLSQDQISFRAKLNNWVRNTKTGDRSELQLTGREQQLWENVSATNYNLCEKGRDGTCFYRQARENVANAHLVIINHSLLLSNVLVGEALIPEFEHLVIDEAHNLESEATSQFGFQLAQTSLEELGGRLDDTLNRSIQSLGKGRSVSGTKSHILREVKKIQAIIRRMQRGWSRLVTLLEEFVEEQKGAALTSEESIRITGVSRVQPSWSGLEIAWAELDQCFEDIESMVDNFIIDVERFSQADNFEQRSLSLEFTDLMQREARIRDQIRSFFAYPDPSVVYWLDIIFPLSGGRSIRLNGAPLNVGEHLNHHLYSFKRSIVLTSATLAIRGDFTHAKNRLGLEDSSELRLNSPFDYEKAVLFCVPTDMPEPSDPNYVESISRAIFELVVMAGGQTMVLFTAHSMLQAVAKRLHQLLKSSPINLLIQSTDGTPHQLIERFQRESEAVLLGTASFWEGVDIGNGSLKILVLARLPFNVPTDPIFMARSELYEDSFREYALPQAVLRFRQGFGRLIRGSEDFGAVVVLDRRVSSSNYGRWFTGSIPPTTKFDGSIEEIRDAVERWITKRA